MKLSLLFRFLPFFALFLQNHKILPTLILLSVLFWFKFIVNTVNTVNTINTVNKMKIYPHFYKSREYCVGDDRDNNCTFLMLFILLCSLFMLFDVILCYFMVIFFLGEQKVFFFSVGLCES